MDGHQSHSIRFRFKGMLALQITLRAIPLADIICNLPRPSSQEPNRFSFGTWIPNAPVCLLSSAGPFDTSWLEIESQLVENKE